MPLLESRRFRTKYPNLFIFVMGTATEEYGDTWWRVHLAPQDDGFMRDENRSFTGTGFTRRDAFQDFRNQLNTVLQWKMGLSDAQLLRDKQELADALRELVTEIRGDLMGKNNDLLLEAAGALGDVRLMRTALDEV